MFKPFAPSRDDGCKDTLCSHSFSLKRQIYLPFRHLNNGSKNKAGHFALIVTGLIQNHTQIVSKQRPDTYTLPWWHTIQLSHKRTDRLETGDRNLKTPPR